MGTAPEFLRRRDAADYLKSRYGIGTMNWLAKLATVGGGPIMTKIGGAACYSKNDLDEWMRSRMTRKQSTSVVLDDAPAAAPKDNEVAA